MENFGVADASGVGIGSTLLALVKIPAFFAQGLSGILKIPLAPRVFRTGSLAPADLFSQIMIASYSLRDFEDASKGL